MKTKLTLFLIALSYFSRSQMVDGGNGHAVILDKNKEVWTVGRNNFGQLGDSSLNNCSIPKKVSGLKNIIAISRGYDHSIALHADGTLWLWGRNNYGQLGSSLPLDGLVPQQLKSHRDFIAVKGGHWHTVALKKNGTVWSWGHNYYGELGDGTREHSAWPKPVICEIELPGGKNIQEPLKDVIQIATVGYHTLALKNDGTVWSWGTNDYRELGYAGEVIQPLAKKIKVLSEIKQVATGWHHSVALDDDGKVWIWGSDPAFQFKETTLKHFDAPIRLGKLPKIEKIACGSWHSLAIDINGEVWGWGKNHFGMLGMNDTISRTFPVKIKSLKNITDIGAGCFQSMAVDSSGKIWTFGDNPTGQLGVGWCGRSCVPIEMSLDINGNVKPMDEMANVTQPKVDKKTASENLSIVKKEKVENFSFAYILLAGILLVISLALNVYLWRQQKKFIAIQTDNRV